MNLKKKQKKGAYDFYFMIYNKEYIIEMDGEQHKDNFTRIKSWACYEDQHHIDITKDNLASKHDIKVIRINCERSDLNFIKKGITHSDLNDILDLSKIDWHKVGEYSANNLVKVACDYKKDNPNLTSAEVGNIMNLSSTTMQRYFKKGMILGWCYYNGKEEKNKARNNQGGHHKKVEVFKDEVSFGVFNSCSELQRQSNELFGVTFRQSCISLCCRNLKKEYKGFTFKYIDTNNINPTPLFKPQLCLPLPKVLPMPITPPISDELAITSISTLAS